MAVRVAINGIGERAGNAAMEEIVMAIRTRSDLLPHRTRIVTQHIIRASRLVSAITDGRSRAASASAQHSATSTASAGRKSCSRGIARRLARCSIGWCVGPSSPSPMESCVIT